MKINCKRMVSRLEKAGVAVLLLLLWVLLARVRGAEPEPDYRADLRTLSQGWYQLQGQDATALTLPAQLEKTGDSSGKVVLVNDTLTAEDAGKLLSVSGVQDDLEVWLGKTLLYRYTDNAFPKNDQMKAKMWADVLLPEETGTAPLRIIYSAPREGTHAFLAPAVGVFYAIAGYHLQNSLVSILVVVGMLAIGLLALACYLYIGKHQIREARFLDVSLFLLLCSLWCITDSGMVQCYGRATAAWSIVSFYAFMLMSVPMIHFVQNTVSPSLGWATRVLAGLFYLNALVQGGVNLVWGVPFIQMLFGTHILLTLGVLMLVGILLLDYRRNHTDESRLCLVAFGLLGLGGVTALVLYWALEISWYGAIFQLGILLYIALLFWGLLAKVAQDAKFRTEQAVWERLSREDRLTGMQNRKAYQEYLETLAVQRTDYSNAVLVYILLEGLQKLNSLCGTGAGDEAVISAARCVEAACAADQAEQTLCFRIRGNEFAVVVPEAKLSPQEREALLEKALQQAAGPSFRKHQTWLVQGFSGLCRADGTLMTLSDWQNAADQALQKNRAVAGGGWQ